MGETKNFKRGADHHNPVNTGLPEEYVVLVGSCTNSFNGYEYYDAAKGDFAGMPHPKNVRGVKTFIHGYPGAPASTHDLYWANFLDPATRLYSQGIVQPREGDIVTIVVYLKGYLWRQKLDWDASPYNSLLHRDSPWVRGNPAFDPYAQRRGPRLPVPVPARRGAFENPAPPPVYKVNAEDAEEVINHHILMQTTSENTAEAIKRPKNAHDYEDYIHDLPRKIIFGPTLGGEARMPNVLVRLLLVNDQAAFHNYIETGEFSGERWIHLLDKHSEDDMSSGARVNDTGSFWDQALAASDKKWIIRWAKMSAAGHVKGGRVNRKKIKIKRFDYVGHSADNCFYILYGWGNQKGERPDGDKFCEFWFAKNFPSKAGFTRDATAWLWGCNLGKEFARDLTDRFKTVTAAEIETDFTHILDTGASMPEPMDHTWHTYDKRTPRPGDPDWAKWNSGP